MDEVAIVNGLSIAYQVEGHGEPVILLHGNGLSRGMWKHNVGPLSLRFKVFAPDLPGFGQSDKPDADYGVEYYVEFLRSFMDALQIEKAAIVGHSFLGVVAATFAVRRPGPGDEAGAGRCLRHHLHGQPRLQGRAQGRPVDDGPEPQNLLRAIAVRRLHGLRLDGVWLLPDSKDSRRAFYRNCREILDINLDYIWLLGQVRAPALVLGGSCDRLVPPKGIRKYGELIRGSQTVFFEKCAHLPNVESPDKFNTDVMGFLA